MSGLVMLFAVALVLLIGITSLLLAWEMRHPPRHTAAWAIARRRPCDPADLGLAFEEWTVEVDDARLPVWEIEGRKAPRDRGIEASSGDKSTGITVVMVHGWGESRVHLLSRLEPWIERAARIILYDLRGHGEATVSASRLGDGEQRDLLRLINQIGDGPVVLAGWSMGGVIALVAAAEADDDVAERIRGVVTIGAYADFHTSLRGRLRVQQLPARPLTDLALLIHRATGVLPRGGAAFAGRVQCPVVLIHGEDDAVVPAIQARSLDQLITDSQCVVIPGGDHSEPRAANADQFDQSVVALLDRANTPGTLMSNLPAASSEVADGV